MILPDIATPDGVRIQVTNSTEDDYVRGVVSIRAAHPEGVAVQWSIPERLMFRADVCQIVSEEIQAELEDRVRSVKRLGL